MDFRTACGIFVCFFWDFSLIWWRHHYRWRGGNFDIFTWHSWLLSNEGFLGAKLTETWGIRLNGLLRGSSRLRRVQHTINQRRGGPQSRELKTMVTHVDVDVMTVKKIQYANELLFWFSSFSATLLQLFLQLDFKVHVYIFFIKFCIPFGNHKSWIFIIQNYLLNCTFCMLE